jgi:serine/tyrosine/threonine adenylyltransferase
MESSDEFLIAPAAISEPARSSVRFGFDNTYARLPERFYARLDPTPVAARVW